MEGLLVNLMGVAGMVSLPAALLSSILSITLRLHRVERGANADLYISFW